MIFLHRYFDDNAYVGDDRITVKKVSEGLFSIRYYDPTAQNVARPMLYKGLSYAEVMTYMERLVRILQADTQPFEYLQLTPPLMPSVLLKLKLSKEDIDAFLDAISFALKHWPTPVCELQKIL